MVLLYCGIVLGLVFILYSCNGIYSVHILGWVFIVIVGMVFYSCIFGMVFIVHSWDYLFLHSWDVFIVRYLVWIYLCIVVDGIYCA